MKFVYPMLILGAVAIVFGVLLAYLGKKLAIKIDEKLEKTQDLLCGANCGACGYAGCNAFAKALVEGKASLSACNATAKEDKDEIAKILGLENNSQPIKMQVVCCGGENCKDKYDYSGLEDCRGAHSLSGGRKICDFGCMGLGSCAKACEEGGIQMLGGVPVINQDSCIKCGLCVKACPRGLIKAIPETAKVVVVCTSRKKGKEVKQACSAGCIACGLCVKNCPNGAITMVNNLPIINYDLCNGCGKCADKCPCKSIKKI